MIASRLRDELHTARRMCDELYVMWCAARCEANEAYETWCEEPGSDSYAVYVAAEDRADAAEREYAAACARVPVAA
jgi:hypothetical protein